MPCKKHFRKRDAILEYLRQSKSHPSAETVYNNLKADVPDLSLATVYRNLRLFKEQGLIASVATVNGVERFDGNPQSHTHFICDQCHSVEDLMDVEIPTTLKNQVAKATGGTVGLCQLCFTGKCRECQNEGSESA